MEGSQEDLKEFKRLLAAGSTPYVEAILKAEIAKLEPKFPEKKIPEKKKDPEPTLPARKCQNITSYAFLDNKDNAQIIVKEIKGLEKAQIEFAPFERGFEIQIIRDTFDMPNLRLKISPTRKIKPEESKYKVKGEKLTIVLKKKKEFSWGKLQKPYKAPASNREEEIPFNPATGMQDMMARMASEYTDEEKRELNKKWWENRQKRIEREEDFI